MKKRFYQNVTYILVKTPVIVLTLICLTILSMGLLVTKINMDVFNEYTGEYIGDNLIEFTVPKKDLEEVSMLTRVYYYENKDTDINESHVVYINEEKEQYIIGIKCKEYCDEVNVSICVKQQTLLKRIFGSK